MRVPQQSRKFFAGAISSAGVETGFCLTVYGDYLADDDFRNGLIWRILGFLNLEDDTDRLSRNVHKELQLYSA